MNRSRFLLPALLAAVLVLGACSKTEEKTASSSAPATPAASADSAKRAPTVEIVANEGKGFAVGSMMSANTVYVFFDPQCPHCAHLWNAAIPLQKKVRFVWMPVGLINATSSAQGATLLSSADPAQAMTEHETSLIAGKGGIGSGASPTRPSRRSPPIPSCSPTSASKACPSRSSRMPAPASWPPAADQWTPPRWPA